MFTLNIKINHLYHTYLLIIFLKRNKAKCIVWNETFGINMLNNNV